MLITNLKNVKHVLEKCIRYIPKMCIEKQWEPEIKQKKTN